MDGSPIVVKKMLEAISTWLGTDVQTGSWIVALSLVVLLFVCICGATWVLRTDAEPPVIIALFCWFAAIMAAIIALADVIAIVVLWTYWAVPYFHSVASADQYGDHSTAVVAVSLYSIIGMIIVIGGAALAGDRLADEF